MMNKTLIATACLMLATSESTAYSKIVVEDVRIGSCRVKEGDPVEIQVRFKNRGTARSDPAPVEIQWNGRTIGLMKISAIAPGHVRQERFRCQVNRTGHAYVRVLLESGTKVGPELRVARRPRPDVAFLKVESLKPAERPGARATYRVTVLNEGEVRARNVRLEVFGPGRSLFSRNLGSFRENEHRSFEIRLNTPGCGSLLRFELDPKRTLDERDRNDNRLAL